MRQNARHHAGEVRRVRAEAACAEQEHLCAAERGQQLGRFVGAVAAVRPEAHVHAVNSRKRRAVHLAHVPECEPPVRGQRLGNGLREPFRVPGPAVVHDGVGHATPSRRDRHAIAVSLRYTPCRAPVQ